MIKIFDSIWLNGLIGMVIVVVITIENIVLNRRKTFTVMMLDQLFWGILAVILFGWPVLLLLIPSVLLLGYMKFRDRFDEEYSYLDYSEGIFSISKVINEFNLKKMKKDKIIVGQIVPVNYYDIPNNMKAIPLSDTVLSGSMLLTGSTGSGKSSTLKSLMIQAAKKHKMVFFFDYKGETDILDDLESVAHQLNIPYYEFSTRRCDFTYDPLVNLNETGKVEALMNTRRWAADGADEHYKSQAQLLFQDIISAYEDYREGIQEEKKENYILGLYRFARGVYRASATEKDGYQTLVRQLEILITSRAKELFDAHSNKPVFSFEDDKPKIVAFSFISSNKALANYLSSFIYQDLMDRGTRRTYSPKALLAIDEFGTLENSTIIKDLLEKGRSGGIQTVFSVLDINQIVMTSGQAFVQSILGTINTFIIHAGATSNTAELMGSVYRYDAEFDIMSLEKPQNDKPPTCLFISKYKILNKKGAQEAHKMIPYLDKVESVNKEESNKKENKNIYHSTHSISKPVEQEVDDDFVDEEVEETGIDANDLKDYF